MKKRTLRLGALLGIAALSVVGVAAATHTEPILVAGNPSCAGGVTIEPVASGTYGAFTLSVNNTALGQTFDFTSTELVEAVIVKGGPNANFYDYGAAPVASDTGLHSPLNAKNGKYYGLSHVCVFSEKKAPPPPPDK